MVAGSKAAATSRERSRRHPQWADYRIWDPATDAHLPANFNLQNIAGKRVCKTALQAELGLEVDAEAALVVLVSRITEQKMADVVAVRCPGSSRVAPNARWSGTEIASSKSALS